MIQGQYHVLLKYILAVAKLLHHPDGMILHTSGESRENKQTHVTIIEENGERLRIGRDDAPGHQILGQGRQRTVGVTDTRNSLGVIAVAVRIESRALGMHDLYPHVCSKPNLLKIKVSKASAKQ